MFPDVTFLGLELYDWCIIFGVMTALLVARVYSDLLKIPVRLQNLIYVTAFFAIGGGIGGAILFQSVYNWIETGVFRWQGMTFYGGLICGAVIFLVGYFAVGKKVCGEQPKEYFSKAAGMAACAITVAHAIGRLGCLFAGCCYGKATNAWYGVYLPAVGERVIPTQLIECIFLLCLFVVLSLLLFKTKIPPLGVYLSVYGVFRFCIEFVRNDKRGKFVGALTPSQFWSILLILAGVCVIALPCLVRHLQKKRGK